MTDKNNYSPEKYLKLAKDITNWIKNYAVSNDISTLVVGISGGVDSSLVAFLCAKTNLKTILVSLPANLISNLNKASENALRIFEKLKDEGYNNVSYKETNILGILDNISFHFCSSNLSEANTLSRLRMTMLYAIATDNNGIVVGTGNKVEDFGIGFFTKYGDGGVDISPIGDLLKSEVRFMASLLGVPDYIVNAAPTDGLWEDGRTDEDQIGASYDELEWAMSLTERQKEVISIYNKFSTKNKHKMLPPPVFKVNK